MFKKYSGTSQESGNAPASPPQTQQSPSSTSATQSQAPISQPAAAKQPQQQASSSAPASSAAGKRNVLSNDVEIKGNVKFDNDLLVDGKIEGEINSKGSLTIGENARIKAEIKTKSVVIYGKVHGNVTVTDRVELKANAEMIGDIKAAVISIEPGATFVGRSTVGAPSSMPASSGDSAAKPANKQQPQPKQEEKKPAAAK